MACVEGRALLFEERSLAGGSGIGEGLVVIVAGPPGGTGDMRSAGVVGRLVQTGGLTA